MSTSHKKQSLTESQMIDIMERFDTDREFCISRAFSDGGAENPFPRLRRAALNQLDEGEATVSRYGIWANTVRDNVIEAEKEMSNGNSSKARRLLIRAANSLSAFAEIQANFDTMEVAKSD